MGDWVTHGDLVMIAGCVRLCAELSRNINAYNIDNADRTRCSLWECTRPSRPLRMTAPDQIPDHMSAVSANLTQPINQCNDHFVRSLSTAGLVEGGCTLSGIPFRVLAAN